MLATNALAYFGRKSLISLTPGQQEDLLVEPNRLNGLVGDELWLQDRDDPGLDPGEHAGVDVVRADDRRVDVLRVTANRQLNPIKKSNLSIFSPCARGCDWTQTPDFELKGCIGTKFRRQKCH